MHFVFLGLLVMNENENENNEKKNSQIRELNAGRKLYEKMMQFKLSVPLMAKLQNDSLRKRHWQHLMDKTGHHFSIDPKEFRLSDMFAMNLYKYQVRKLFNQSNFKYSIQIEKKSYARTNNS